MSKSGKSGSSGSQSHVQHRDARSGQYVTERQADRMKPENVVRERVPNPGHGDTGRGGRKK
jgi:hypothetical protein